MGKIFHPGASSGGDDPQSWTEPYYHAPNYKLWQYFSRPGQGLPSLEGIGQPSWTAVPTAIREKEPLPDEQIAAEAVKRLEELAEQDKPFFLAVGFYKPHLPFVFPAEFLQHYPAQVVELPPNHYAPDGMPTIAWHNTITVGLIGRSVEVKHSNYSGNINTTMADMNVLNLQRAYYACSSYIDSLVGQLLNKLEEVSLANNTVVSFLGDHGFHLGENGEWKKQTNFEVATRVPMMVHIPGKTDQGIVTHKLTEAIDIFPTIVYAAGLPPVSLCPENASVSLSLCSEGTSLMPLINDSTNPWKAAVFSQVTRATKALDEEVVTETLDAMGYSLRTNQFR